MRVIGQVHREDPTNCSFPQFRPLVRRGAMDRLRAEYPREWSIVSSADGSAVAPASLRARILQLGGSPKDNVAQNPEELLRCLERSHSASSRRRWAALRAAVLRRKSVRADSQHNDGAVRAALWCVSSEPNDDAWEMTTLHPRKIWLSAELESSFPLRLPRRRAREMTLAELTSHRSQRGVDNTGNVCVWPAEEVLACLLVRQRAFATGRNVLELGAGHQGLAGWALAAAEPSCRVHITDGNEQAAASLSGVRSRVPDAGLRARVSTGLCRWDDPASLAGSFSLVVAADCLFFEDFHEDLLATVWRAWYPSQHREEAEDESETVVRREAWFVAPSRGASLDRFVDKARRFRGPTGAEGMAVTVRSSVDPVVDSATAELEREAAAFVRDRHQFFLILLQPSIE